MKLFKEIVQELWKIDPDKKFRIAFNERKTKYYFTPRNVLKYHEEWLEYEVVKETQQYVRVIDPKHKSEKEEIPTLEKQLFGDNNDKDKQEL